MLPRRQELQEGISPCSSYPQLLAHLLYCQTGKSSHQQYLSLSAWTLNVERNSEAPRGVHQYLKQGDYSLYLHTPHAPKFTCEPLERLSHHSLAKRIIVYDFGKHIYSCRVAEIEKMGQGDSIFLRSPIV